MSFPLRAALPVAASLNVAFACAGCLAGDPNLMTAGTEAPYAGRLRFSLDMLSRGETFGENNARYELSEERLTVSIAYAPSESTVLATRLPYARKTLKTPSLARYEAEGFSDAELLLHKTLWRDNSAWANHITGVNLILRVPTATEIKEDGEPLDIDVQPGAGAWVPQLGGWYMWRGFGQFIYASITAHFPGEGFADFEAGDAVTSAVKYQRIFDDRFALSLGMDARWAQKDRYNGEIDEESGGSIVFISPGALWEFSERMRLDMDVQIPWLNDLRGNREEEIHLRIGARYEF